MKAFGNDGREIENVCYYYPDHNEVAVGFGMKVVRIYMRKMRFECAQPSLQSQQSSSVVVQECPR